MPSKYPQTLVALDIESTDISPEKGEIIEVAAIKYRRGKKVDKFHSLIKPEKKIPPVVKSITNITDEMVADSPGFGEIRDELASFLDDFPIVGHNIGFDIAFLRANGIELKNNPAYDTWRLATILYQGMRSYSLEAITDRLGLTHEEKHRAEADAIAGQELFYHLVDKIRELPASLVRDINSFLDRQDWPLKTVFREAEKLDSVAGSSGKGKSSKSLPKKQRAKVDFATDKIEKIMSQNGIAKKKLSGYEYRPSQVEMLKQIAEAFAKSQFRLVEAPPGVGKSMAYLLPAVTFAKANQEQVIVSTYTRSLQDQLVQKDLPVIAKIVPFDFTAAVLKGRRQYLCRRLFENFTKRVDLNVDEITTIVKLMVWEAKTKTGEFDELALTYEDRPIIVRLAADHHTCQGRQCPHWNKCFVNLARKKAKQADIVVVNHALLLREPRLENEPVLTAAHLIIDEAHELEEAATDAYSHSLTKDMLDDWLNKISNRKRKGGLVDILPRRKIADSLAEISGLQQETALVANDSALFFGLVGMFARRFQEESKYRMYQVSLNEELRYQKEWQRLEETGESLSGKIKGLAEKLTKLSEKVGDKLGEKDKRIREQAKDMLALAQEGKILGELLTEMINSPKADHVYWVTVRNDESFILQAAPLRVDEMLQNELYKDKKTILMTSATLSTAGVDESGRVDASFDYFKDRLGLADFEFSRAANVFDYKKQALIYIPGDIDRPESPRYSKDLARTIKEIATKLGGKTMVLFTSYSGIKKAYKELAEPLKKEKIDVLAQGVTGGKMKLLQQFKKSPRAVLLGTATFWQGVDIPGEKLSCLIMAKLPFNVPSEPVFKARQEGYANGFTEYAVPLAILRFRQGFGRLIRSRTDRGVMVIMDNRVEKSNYGLMFMQSLPESEVKYGKLRDVADTTADWLKISK